MLKKKRRKAVQYAQIEKVIDMNGKELMIGDYISILKENKKNGPITKIFHEITGSAHESIQKIVYVNDNFYLLDNIIKID